MRAGVLTMRHQARNQRHTRARWLLQSASALDECDAVVHLDVRSATLAGELAMVVHTGAALATVTAARFNLVIHARYEHVRAAGTPPDVAR